MALIRRIYIYLACLISLQSVVAALTALLGGIVRWLVGTNAPETLFLTFQLAVIIVGTPIYLGHWLWALYLARKDPAEFNALSRRLYLYITKGVFVGYMAVAAFNGVGALISFILPATTQSAPPTPELFGTLINSGMTLAVVCALWLYHECLTVSSHLTHDSVTRGIDQLYMLGFAGAGLVLAVTGLVWMYTWILNRIDGDARYSLPPAIALIVAGVLVWGYHELRRGLAIRTRDATASVLRWMYAILFNGTGVIMFVIGLTGTQMWLFHRLAGEPSSYLLYSLALLTASLPLLLYHELAVYLSTSNAVRPLRWLYSWLFSMAGMYGAVAGIITALQWLFATVGGSKPGAPDGAAVFVPCLMVWGYHHWVMQRIGKPLGLTEDSAAGFAGAGRFLLRIYIFLFSGSGVVLATVGLIGLQEWVFTRLGGQEMFRLPDALACLLAGIPVWLFYWHWAGQLFRSGFPDERKSDLRKVYLYAIVYSMVNTVIVTVALLINGLLRGLLGLPTGGQLGLSLSIIIAAGALWAYHALVLRSDIAQAGESSLQAGMQRLYWYLVSALGLAAFLVGLAGELSVGIRWLALGFSADTALREQFAGFTAALVAGFPVWLSAWLPAQSVAAQFGPLGLASRRSVLRKIYLYTYALTAVMVTLVFAIAAVYQFLNALFGVFGGGNVLADTAQSVGFTVIAAVAWLYHTWILRGDSQRAKHDKEVEVQRKAQERETAQAKLAEVWAQYPVIVIDDGDGSFGHLALEALGRDLPFLKVMPLGLSQQAGAAQSTSASADIAALLASAACIIAPWTAVTLWDAAECSGALKIIAPVGRPGITWAGVTPTIISGAQIVEAVKCILPKLSQLDRQPAATGEAQVSPWNEPLASQGQGLKPSAGGSVLDGTSHVT